MHAVRNFLTKKAQDKQIFVWLYINWSLGFFLLPFLYLLHTSGIDSIIVIGMGIVSGFVQFLYMVFLSKSYQHGDLSHVYPIMRSAPALVLVFAIIFLKEKVDALGVLGILFIVLGVYAINMKRFTLSALFEPIESFTREKAVQYAVLTMVTTATYSIIDKIAVSLVHPIIHMYLLTICAQILFSGYIYQTKDLVLIGKEWRLNKWSIIVAGFLEFVGYSLILIAFTFERVSYIIGLRQISIVFAVIMGGGTSSGKKIRG